MSMSATNNFSEQFLEYFPCHYSHHGPFTCQFPQRDRVWTPEMKKVVFHEIDEKNHTTVKIAAYLQVNEQRLKNLKSTIREKGHFRPFVGRPVKLDAIAEHTIVDAVKKGVETLTPLKKTQIFETFFLKMFKRLISDSEVAVKGAQLAEQLQIVSSIGPI